MNPRSKAAISNSKIASALGKDAKRGLSNDSVNQAVKRAPIRGGDQGHMQFKRKKIEDKTSDMHINGQLHKKRELPATGRLIQDDARLDPGATQTSKRPNASPHYLKKSITQIKGAQNVSVRKTHGAVSSEFMKALSQKQQQLGQDRGQPSNRPEVSTHDKKHTSWQPVKSSNRSGPVGDEIAMGKSLKNPKSAATIEERFGRIQLYLLDSMMLLKQLGIEQTKLQQQFVQSPEGPQSAKGKHNQQQLSFIQRKMGLLVQQNYAIALQFSQNFKDILEEDNHKQSSNIDQLDQKLKQKYQQHVGKSASVNDMAEFKANRGIEADSTDTLLRQQRNQIVNIESINAQTQTEFSVFPQDHEVDKLDQKAVVVTKKSLHMPQPTVRPSPSAKDISSTAQNATSAQATPTSLSQTLQTQAGAPMSGPSPLARTQPKETRTIGVEAHINDYSLGQFQWGSYKVAGAAKGGVFHAQRKGGTAADDIAALSAINRPLQDTQAYTPQPLLQSAGCEIRDQGQTALFATLCPARPLEAVVQELEAAIWQEARGDDEQTQTWVSAQNDEEQGECSEADKQAGTESKYIKALCQVLRVLKTHTKEQNAGEVRRMLLEGVLSVQQFVNMSPVGLQLLMAQRVQPLVRFQKREVAVGPDHVMQHTCQVGDEGKAQGDALQDRAAQPTPDPAQSYPQQHDISLHSQDGDQYKSGTGHGINKNVSGYQQSRSQQRDGYGPTSNYSHAQAPHADDTRSSSFVRDAQYGYGRASQPIHHRGGSTGRADGQHSLNAGGPQPPQQYAAGTAHGSHQDIVSATYGSQYYAANSSQRAQQQNGTSHARSSGRQSRWSSQDAGQGGKGWTQGPRGAQHFVGQGAAHGQGSDYRYGHEQGHSQGQAHPEASYSKHSHSFRDSQKGSEKGEYWHG